MLLVPVSNDTVPPQVGVNVLTSLGLFARITSEFQPMEAWVWLTAWPKLVLPWRARVPPRSVTVPVPRVLIEALVAGETTVTFGLIVVPPA